MNKALGYLAALSWVVLSGVTVIGAFAKGASLLHVNLLMAVLFMTIALFVAWRTLSVDRLCNRHPASPEMSQVLMIELLASLAMLALGVLCVFGATIRVWSESVSVFG